MPGRIYGIDKDKPGERFASGCRVFTHMGARVPFVQRVEFDDDASEGMARVSLVIVDATGHPLLDPEKNEVCKATVRLWVRVVERGQPDMSPTPNAVLYVENSNKLVRHEIDPIPDEAFVAMGGTVEREVKRL
jgi:hypothetical protein